MLTKDEGEEVIRLMKTNGFVLSEADSAQMEFSSRVKARDYRVTILVIEDLVTLMIKADREVLLDETTKTVADLKVFLEERLYTYLKD